MGGGEAEHDSAIFATLRFVDGHCPRREEVGEDLRFRVLDGLFVEGDGSDVRIDGRDDT